MPYKAWTVNEILTASDMNTYVGNQTVLSFAGTAARASALAAPVEGMVSYLEDTDRLEVYKGTATGWVATVFPGGTPVANHLLQYDGTDWQSVSQSEAGAIAVFAGTAARGSAIPSPTEGMVTYLEDSDSVQVYNGSAFIAVGSDPGLVEVKSAIFTGTQSASVATGAALAVTDLSITHTLANASNKLFLMASIGAAATTHQRGEVGVSFADGGTAIGVGATGGSRVSVGAGGAISGSASDDQVTMPSIQLLYAPGDTASHTYTVQVYNVDVSTRTLYVNRAEADDDAAARTRAASVFTLMEVSV